MANNPGRSRKEFWEHHLAGWDVSGLSQADYCRSNKINIKSFQYWKRKIKGNGNVPVLVEVPFRKSLPIAPVAESHRLCLVIDRQYRIEIAQGFNAEDLERVVRVLMRI
jgi:hypothetical protein